MSVRTITTREFICNHCGAREEFDHDAAAGRAGWALLTVNNKDFALCPEHYPELKAFLNVDSFGPPLGSVQPESAPITLTPAPRGILGVHYPYPGESTHE